ncbi:hypothetical protein KKF84_19030, partial [Myxococcota bacterium]|nr:hypothetical protein [Myxococcota bacterium]
EDDEPNPVRVSGLTDTVTDISAGSGFTCAVTSGGAVYCWGENLHGKLGTGDTTDHFVPTLINTPLSDFIQVSAGASNACAVRSTGTVQCWGINDNGNMGRCTSGSENQLSPAAVIQYCPSTQLMNVVQVEVAFSHVCARTNATDSNQVYCWGNNYFGQIGLNNTSSPIDHASLALRVAHTSQPTAPVEAQQISVGAFHSCAIGYGPVAQIYCWGNDASGRLGNGDTMGDTTYGWETQRVVDRMANTIDFTDAVTIVTGERHSIAITTDGTPCGWGDNGEGQAGGVTASASVQAARTATMLMPFMPITSITAGEEHSCLVTGDGAAYCFGNNDYGQLGDGSTTSSATPVAVLFY